MTTSFEVVVGGVGGGGGGGGGARVEGEGQIWLFSLFGCLELLDY